MKSRGNFISLGYHFLFLILILFFSGCAGKSSYAGSDASTNDINGQLPPPGAVLENNSFRYVIGTNGQNLSFTDRARNQEYLSVTAPSYCAAVRKGDQEFAVTGVSQKDQQITLTFADAAVSAVLNLERHDNYYLIEVASLDGEGVTMLKFLNVPLTLSGRPSEPFGACALALNLRTDVNQLPALQSVLAASAHSRLGIVGAKLALVGAPPSSILGQLKEVISAAPELPRSTVGGPWAREVASNVGSYVFNFGTMNESNVDTWIGNVKNVGFTQIDNHGGDSFFRFGDLQMNSSSWPQGWAAMKRINQKLHAAGLGSILHTYAFFLSKQSKYVTPVPSADLDAMRTFTLAADLSASSTEIAVNESTTEVSTITSFFINNSVTLHVDNELITFSGVTKTAPYKFTGVTRGAFGTTAAAHSVGTKARQLKELFGYFAPHPDSALFEEVAKNHAQVVNDNDFDAIYFDAIDGSYILAGEEFAWYYGPKFVFLVQKYLNKSIGMEMSAMWHNFWLVRSRYGAWDAAVRGHRKFLDQHIQAIDNGMMLPSNLGWWQMVYWDPPQRERIFPEDIDYLGSKMIGFQAGLSMLAVPDAAALQAKPAFARAVTQLRDYQDVLKQGVVDDSVKQRLREVGQEFVLQRDTSSGAWRFRESATSVHRVEGKDHPSNTWTFHNPFGPQPLRARVESMMTVSPYDDASAVLLADAASAAAFAYRQAASGVTVDLQSSTEQVKVGSSSLLFSATNSGATPVGAWATVVRTFPPLDLRSHQGLGVWVYGDGQGELLNFRLQNADGSGNRAIADHYVVVDFTGWRYVELVESEAARHDDYSWPVTDQLYGVFREEVDYSSFARLSLWLNNIPAGKTVKVFLSPLRALPLVSSRIYFPSLTINGQTVTLPTDMASTNYVELNSATDCPVYDVDGKLLGNLVPQGQIPTVASGLNTITLGSSMTFTNSVRAKVYLFTRGNLL